MNFFLKKKTKQKSKERKKYKIFTNYFIKQRSWKVIVFRKE